jgi:hypothetical protein
MSLMIFKNNKDVLQIILIFSAHHTSKADKEASSNNVFEYYNKDV